MVRIDRIWNGAEYPIVITQGAVTASIGMPLDDWRCPADVVMAKIQLALEVAFPAPVWTTYVDTATGGVIIACDTAFDCTLRPGLAAFWGFSTTTFLGTLAIVSDATPQWILPDYKASFGLPVCWWLREVQGDRTPVLWDTAFIGFDLTITRNRFDAAPVFDLTRVPFVLVQSSVLPWNPAVRTGWLALRPLADQYQRAPVGSGADWGRIAIRCLWLSPTVGA